MHPAPPVPPDRDDLDTTRLGDEQLVMLAAGCGHRPARDELIRRYLPLKERLVSWSAAHAGLQEADRQDAQQDAVLWMVEAIRRYRAEEHVKPGGCHFRSFLHRVLTARFIDFLRRRRRLQNHFPLTGVVPAVPARDGGHHQHAGGAPGGKGVDPVRSAEEGEFRRCLLGELAQLNGAARRLWALLAEGAPLRKIAAELNLSYDAVKRRRHRLFAKLRSCLGKGQGR